MRRQRGFTLVELLVVIGIIGILLSILIPTINGIRKRAKESECTNNLRQIFQATMLATNEQNGQMPRPAIQEDNRGNANAFKDYAIRMKEGTAIGDAIADFRAGGLLLKFLGGDETSRQRTWYCPLDKNEHPTQGSYRTERNFSYSYNRYIRPAATSTGSSSTPNPADYVIRLEQVRKPGSRIMVFEEVGPNDFWCSEPATAASDWPSNRHARGGKPPSSMVNQDEYAQSDAGTGNHLFFDGHTEALTPKQVIAGATAQAAQANTSYYTPLER
jgi:prepilin-type N-terminal cleavage/methylation domain-containing protein